jgi:hypothetical protein
MRALEKDTPGYQRGNRLKIYFENVHEWKEGSG